MAPNSEKTVTVCDSCLVVVANGDISHLAPDNNEADESTLSNLDMLHQPCIGLPLGGYSTCWGCSEEVIDATRVSAYIAD